MEFCVVSRFLKIYCKPNAPQMQTSDDTSSKAFAIKKYQKNVNGKASTEKFDMTTTRKHPLERKDDQVSLCDETHNNVDKNI
jgi:hypothetical protein